MAYAELEPFGPPAEFWRAGMIASTLANVNRTKKDQKAFKPEDFMPRTMLNEPDATSPDAMNEQIVRTFQELANLPTGILKP